MSNDAPTPPGVPPTTAPRTHRVLVRPGGQPFEVPPGHSLIEAALAAGVDLPRSCRNGTCRTCMARMVEGRVHYRIAWPGLSFDEHDEGWILPCVAEPDTDLVIELINPATGSAAPLDPAG